MTFTIEVNLTDEMRTGRDVRLMLNNLEQTIYNKYEHAEFHKLNCHGGLYDKKGNRVGTYYVQTEELDFDECHDGIARRLLDGTLLAPKAKHWAKIGSRNLNAEGIPTEPYTVLECCYCGRVYDNVDEITDEQIVKPGCLSGDCPGHDVVECSIEATREGIA